MKRREFIRLIGGAAAAWPLSARAQKSEHIRRIGLLLGMSSEDKRRQAWLAGFIQGLRELDWVEGGNLRIDIRWNASDPNRAQSAATELVNLAPDAILAHGTPALAAVHRATHRIPIVFVVVVDPVGAGYVQSLARPGGNITGFSSFEPEIGGKWLELLKAITPNLARVAGILDPGFKGFAGVWSAIEVGAPRLGLEVTRIPLRNDSDDVESAIGIFAQKPKNGLIVLPTAINNSLRHRIIAAAARYRLPAVYPFANYAADGGLISYGVDAAHVFYRGASYLNRILRGEEPADMPVQAPTKYELVINLKTAKAIGLTVPATLLARADEVIE
jgi:putative ABC transport system substrate-binding protein